VVVLRHELNHTDADVVMKNSLSIPHYQSASLPFNLLAFLWYTIKSPCIDFVAHCDQKFAEHAGRPSSLSLHECMH
jgi:hypothetical protein